MSWLYLISLLVATGSMILIDKRYQLVFFKDAQAGAVTILVGLILFILWDILGIYLGIFFSGHSEYMSGLYVYPELPVEELFFLFFLCYITLIIYRLLETKWKRT